MCELIYNLETTTLWMCPKNNTSLLSTPSNNTVVLFPSPSSTSNNTTALFPSPSSTSNNTGVIFPSPSSTSNNTGVIFPSPSPAILSPSPSMTILCQHIVCTPAPAPSSIHSPPCYLRQSSNNPSTLCDCNNTNSSSVGNTTRRPISVSDMYWLHVLWVIPLSILCWLLVRYREKCCKTRCFSNFRVGIAQRIARRYDRRSRSWPSPHENPTPLERSKSFNGFDSIVI